MLVRGGLATRDRPVKINGKRKQCFGKQYNMKKSPFIDKLNRMNKHLALKETFVYNINIILWVNNKSFRNKYDKSIERDECTKWIN